MKIRITEKAEERLKEIFQYYKQAASVPVARRIKNDILQRIKMLRDYKELGPVDEHLKYLNLGHRKLTQGNYKIVYRPEGSVIYITDIFDTRQDPDAQKP